MNQPSFIQAAEKCGAKVHKAVLLGKYFHISTNKACERKVIELLGVMKPTKIAIMNPGKDGKHLDGSKHHRIVAIF
ncbi:MAG: hypothetical protein ACYC4K_08660 [Thiobacillus sp.]